MPCSYCNPLAAPSASSEPCCHLTEVCLPQPTLLKSCSVHSCAPLKAAVWAPSLWPEHCTLGSGRAQTRGIFWRICSSEQSQNPNFYSLWPLERGGLSNTKTFIPWTFTYRRKFIPLALPTVHSLPVTDLLSCINLTAFISFPQTIWFTNIRLLNSLYLMFRVNSWFGLKVSKPRGLCSSFQSTLNTEKVGERTFTILPVVQCPLCVMTGDPTVKQAGGKHRNNGWSNPLSCNNKIMKMSHLSVVELHKFPVLASVSVD